MRTASLLVALATLGAGAAGAQSTLIAKPKAAAQKAVAATNAHTTAMTTMPSDSAPRDSGKLDAASQAATGRSTQTAAGSTAVATKPDVVSFERETFRYERSGRRDPFMSLMNSGELRPLITELRVTSIAYSTQGGSVAILRNLGTKEQYRVRVGDSLGRMRVARINARSITFTIEEFGFSRQETLSLNDPKKESSQ
ncbi:MAG TPA: hypothetical protein VF981_04430 [Gemmatimonadaceae bacterium]|jgi:hypothetical protein